MYGVVLMVAMAGGAETPALFNRGGKGCTGYSCSGCTGYSCTGYSCSGCTGHACCGGRGHRSHKHKGCCGYTSCSGCTGYTSCTGCSGCTGYTSCSGYTGCSGCAGYTGCAGSVSVGCYGAPSVSYPAPGMAPQMMAPEIAPKGKAPEKLKKPPVVNETARITITVPSDALVSIDGSMTVSTETTRSFESPVLEAGKSYTYTFKAEFVRDGQNVVVTRNVKVQAGSEITVSLENANVVASR